MPISNQDPILLTLIDNGVIDQAAADDIIEEVNNSGKTVRDILINNGYVTEDDLLELLGNSFGHEVINLGAASIPPEVAGAISGAAARLYHIIPTEADGYRITLAIDTPPSPAQADEIAFALGGKEITFVLAKSSDLDDRIAKAYGDDVTAIDTLITNLTGMEQIMESGADDQDEKAIEDAAGSAPVIRLVQLVLFQAVNARASDIHFEPFEKIFRIRYRVDGALYEMTPPPRSLALPVISRIKVMAGLNIAERRIPQDGRIQIPVGNRLIDLRVSCLPTQFGESVVLRILDRSVVSLDLENLGMPEDVYDAIGMDIEKPNGIIVVTGPTGSGKTTTLYSCLRRINKEGNKLLTAEEPVEYDIDGIIQVPINPVQGNTFAKVLRAFLRQDPDIIMVGEIRDTETAQIAVQASLTGHLVFSTLHTNDAAGAVTRLMDMDVAPYLIASTLEAVLGQRLLRTICKDCKTEFQPTDDILDMLSLTQQQVGGQPFFHGAGCPTCNQTGYKGRKGLYEYLRVSEPIRNLIVDRSPTLVIREKARELGMRTMREDGIRNILDGYTTVEEVLRYT